MSLFSGRKRYSQLPASDILEDEKSPRAASSHWSKVLIASLLLSATIGTTVLLTLAAVSHPGKLQPCHLQPNQRVDPEHKLDCGSSVEEAIGRGCTFDHLTLLWLPQECVRTGNDEFRQYNDENGAWHYWTDKQGTNTITDLPHALDKEGFWTTQREHTAHCAFVFMRLVDAANGDGIFDQKTWSYEHGEHCARLLLERAMKAPGLDEDMQWARVTFGSCHQRPLAPQLAGATLH